VPSSSFASLERTLDRTIECLVTGAQSREARALLIEARRLRSVVANWRSIPPPSDVHDEMLDRVLQLSTAVGAAVPEAPGHAQFLLPDPDVHGQVGGELTRVVPNAGAFHRDEEGTEAYALDFEPHLYSLETTTNREALPPLYGEPPSEEEPTRAWSNAAVQAPADFEAAPSPSPWPVDEPLDPPRVSPVVATRPSVPPVASPPTHPDPPNPRVAPAAPAPAPRIVTYEFDAEGDDLSVPRTQIVAHAVKLAEPVNPLLVTVADPYSSRADAYRALRRKITAMPTVRVLGITSANPGEGKTVFALNLALTLRESVRSRVLVIEANLRTPIMAKMLGFTTPECFIAQIQRHADSPREPWVVAEPLPKLHVMAIDPQAPHEPMLDPVTFSLGMERLKQAGYEYVIVDSPPVLGSLDCNVISDAVDATILTALPMKSLRRAMRQAVEQLEPAPILGVVLLEG
jgi:Mrp family chromosome partitioning ATPase